MQKLKPIILRRSKPKANEITQIKRDPIYLVLDRIIDTYNVGSLFRLADAIAAEKIYLCGEMEYPPSAKIHKAAVGTENWVAWEKTESTLEVIMRLRKENIQIVAVEQSNKSVDYRQLTTDNFHFPVAIIAGNETAGIEPEVLDQADLIVELPMYGINHSFNVWGSTAVVAYKVLEFLPK